MEPSPTSRIVSFGLLIAIILIIGGLFIKVMATFLIPLFLAALCVVMFRPLHRWILVRCRDRQHLAAGLTTAAILLLVLVPAFSIGTLAAIEGRTVVTNLEVGTIREKVAKLRSRLGLELPLADSVQAVEAALRSMARQAGLIPRTAAEPDHVAGPPVTPADLLAVVEQLQRQLAGSEQLPQTSMDDLMQDGQTLAAQTSGTTEYGDTLTSAQRHFYEFKTSLCGGPYRTQLIELANPSDDVLRRWRANIADKAQAWLLAVGSATTAVVGQLIFGGFVMAVSIYFFLLDGPSIIRTLMRLSPLDDRYERELIDEFDQISRAVVLATLLSAIAQGILAGVGYWIAGLPSVFLLTMVTMVMALVPFVGATAVWLPACLWLYPPGGLRRGHRFDRRQLHQTLGAARPVQAAPAAGSVERPGRRSDAGPDRDPGRPHDRRLPANATEHPAPRTDRLGSAAGRLRSRFLSIPHGRPTNPAGPRHRDQCPWLMHLYRDAIKIRSRLLSRS
ncbi:MAG: AI-2E family transporter [Pirellulaceae bacterium]|nr:AI-2E family transporter [Pirellulaceae bacterium]